MELLLKVLEKSIYPIYIDAELGDGSFYRIENLIKKSGLSYVSYHDETEIKASKYLKSSVVLEKSDFEKSLNEKDVIILCLSELRNEVNINYLKAISEDINKGAYKAKLILIKKSNNISEVELYALQSRMMCFDIESLLEEVVE